MSHLPERADKDCLNCGAVVYGKFCHICGQENKVHKESAWHLITHFFNDITHFDGKFFSSLKYIFFRPGYLSSEYSRGRRSDYLNPVRMYVFTSAIFFLVFFSLYKLQRSDLSDSTTSNWEIAMKDVVPTIDSTAFKKLVYNLILTDSAFSKQQYLSFAKEQPAMDANKVHISLEGKDASEERLEKSDKRWIYTKVFKWNMHDSAIANMNDSELRVEIARRAMLDTNISKIKLEEYLKRRSMGISFGGYYKSKSEYDSLVRVGAEKPGWLKRKLIERQFKLNEKFNNNTLDIVTSLLQQFLHSLPQMLFVSLPILALILKLLYFRRKDFYYVDHAIFTVHLFIFIFLMLLLIFGVNKLSNINYLSILDWLYGLLIMSVFFYIYKAMRNFYMQRRAKTVLKYFLFLTSSFFIICFIFIVFIFFSLFQI